MSRPDPPVAVVDLAERRAQARAARDWQLADELRGRIEAAGWRVIDAGIDFSLSLAQAPDIVEAERTLYGGPASVPSRLSEPDHPGATVIVVAAGGRPPRGVLRALWQHAPAGTDVVVVAGGEVDLDVDELPPDTERLWTATPFGPGAALQAALRRATAATLIVLEPDRVPAGDIVTPLSAALADDRVAICGADGLRSTDLRRYQPAGPGEVTAVAAGCYALRRQEAIARRPFDDRLNLAGSVATWCSLVLRDEGMAQPPRVALAIDLPLESGPVAEPADAGHARLARRDAYRLRDRFGRHTYLSAAEQEVPWVVEDRPDGDQQHDDPDEGSHAAEA